MPKASPSAEMFWAFYQLLTPLTIRITQEQVLFSKRVRRSGQVPQECVFMVEEWRMIKNRELAVTLLKLAHSSYHQRLIPFTTPTSTLVFHKKRASLGRRRAASCDLIEQRAIDEILSHERVASGFLNQTAITNESATKPCIINPYFPPTLAEWKLKSGVQTPTTKLTLNTIPDDLIRSIANFIPLAATTCLSLIGKSVYGAIKVNNLHFDHPNINNTHGDIHDFLNLLARDLPTHIPCFYCCKVHNVPERINYNGFMELKECLRADKELGVFQVLGSNCSFTQLQYAMKLHTTFRDATPYLSNLRHTSRIHSYDTENLSYVVSEARIDALAQEIILRSQCWIVMPRDFIGHVGKLERVIEQGCQNFSVCHHHSMYMESKLSWKLSWKLKCKMAHANTARDSGDCGQCGGITRCKHCEVEVHIEFTDFGEKGVCIVITRWANLGSALSPQDPKWRSFLDRDHHGTSMGALLPCHGGIMRQFEGPVEEFVPSLTAAQEMELWKRF